MTTKMAQDTNNADAPRRPTAAGSAATERGTLAPAESHPAAYSALDWLANVPLAERMSWYESFHSTAIEGNRLAEVCAETLRRTMEGEPVSDRYLLGLVWTMQGRERS